MKIIEDVKLDFDDVLIRPKRSFLTSRADVDLYRKFIFPHSPRTIECVPVMAANMDTTGSMKMADALSQRGCITCLHKHYAINEYVEYFEKEGSNNDLVFYSTGTSCNDLDKMEEVFTRLDRSLNICVDVANGYTEQFVKTLSLIRERHPDVIIMAGNVVTPEMVEELVLHGGVDVVKIGIGSGSVCTTRLKAGVGYPQLSAVMECADAAHGVNAHICSDGGCKTPADVCKAFGANTDFVMLGGMLAGSDCCEGEWEYEFRCLHRQKEFWQPFDPSTGNGKRKTALKFYGMSSKEAMDKHNGGVANYRTSEGKCVRIPYKGTTDEVISDILGGLRSVSTYIGAGSIKDFGKKTTFIRVNNTHNTVYEKS